jgi:hypothetical protein
MAIGFSAAALGHGRVVFVLDWPSNAPVIAPSIYLAFWFHIF